MSLSADVNYNVQGTLNEITDGLAASSITLFKGALCAYNASGLVAKAADTAAFHFAGIAVQQNILGASNTVRVKLENGMIWVKYASAAQNLVGTLFYATADDTIASSATNIGPMGVAVDFATGYMLIDTRKRVA